MIYLMLEFYNSEFENRNLEMRKALDNNLANEHIEKIVLFHEEDVEIPEHDKIISVLMTGRMTFADYFNYANTHIKDKICGIVNSDIYFDDSLSHMKQLKENQFVCLTRWEDDGLDGELMDVYNGCSHDSWFFKGEIPPRVLIESAFYLGKMRCDNRIAFITFNNGYEVFNPASLIKSWHLHEVDSERTYNSNLQHQGDQMRMARVGVVDSFEYDENKVSSLVRLFGGNPSGQDFKAMIKLYKSEQEYEKAWDNQISGAFAGICKKAVNRVDK